MKAYKNRLEAGQVLAQALKRLNLATNSMIFALPRGGVPVAAEIAKILHLPLDLIIVRKIAAPGYAEYAIGALAMHQVLLMDRAISPEIAAIIHAEQLELDRREKIYRRGAPYPDMSGKTAIIIDDGIATGYTMKAAITALKTLNPQKIILAVPVASHEALQELRTMVDQCICPLIPRDFYAVGAWYEHFPQTSDLEVLACLRFNKSLDSI